MANSSNNTIDADDSGMVAYLHPQFLPTRDDRLHQTRPVDGSDPATDWLGLQALNDGRHAVPPRNCSVMNTNNWPYFAASADRPKHDAYPRDMDTFGEHPRGIHAMRVLADVRDFSKAASISAAFDSALPASDTLIPLQIADHDALPESDPRSKPALCRKRTRARRGRTDKTHRAQVRSYKISTTSWTDR